MKYAVVVDASRCTEFAFRPVDSMKSAFDGVVEYVASLPHQPEVVVLTRSDIPAAPGSWKRVPGENWALERLIDALSSVAEDRVVYVDGDTPFLDAELTASMLERHERYYADVSFADGYPDGVAPLILSKRIGPTLGKLQEKHRLPPGRTALLDLIQKDINAFDVETELSPVDLRYLRLTLSADSEEGFELCRRFARLRPAGAADILRIAAEHGEILRVLPAYLSIQVVEREVQRVSYSPYPEIEGFTLEGGEVMSVSDFQALVAEFAGLNPRGVVGMSHWGEFSTHPEALTLIDSVLALGLDLVVETSGIGWDQEVLSKLAAEPRARVSFIVGVDAIDPEIYAEVRGPGFEEAMRFVDWALSAYPSSTYLQAVRLEETEEHLETLYKSLTERTENVIIQKYDHFCGALKQRKVTDISPVIRRPCWHVKRDLVVLIDGTVPLCREDIRRDHVLGNAFRDGLRAAWKRGHEYYLRHVRREYPRLCEQCDEYYTFNF